MYEAQCCFALDTVGTGANKLFKSFLKYDITFPNVSDLFGNLAYLS